MDTGAEVALLSPRDSPPPPASLCPAHRFTVEHKLPESSCRLFQRRGGRVQLRDPALLSVRPPFCTVTADEQLHRTLQPRHRATQLQAGLTHRSPGKHAGVSRCLPWSSGHTSSSLLSEMLLRDVLDRTGRPRLKHPRLSLDSHGGLHCEFPLHSLGSFSDLLFWLLEMSRFFFESGLNVARSRSPCTCVSLTPLQQGL